MKARGLCCIHYRRWRRTGQVELTNRKTPAAERARKWYEVGPADACWPWTGLIETTGYGRIRNDRDQLIGAHRVVYEGLVGPIPAGLTLDHLCRNPPCVNPAHLEPVTQAVNNARKPQVLAEWCRNGHRLTPENLVMRAGGSKRTCRRCERDRRRRWRNAPTAADVAAYVEEVTQTQGSARMA